MTNCFGKGKQTITYCDIKNIWIIWIGGTGGGGGGASPMKLCDVRTNNVLTCTCTYINNYYIFE